MEKLWKNTDRKIVFCYKIIKLMVLLEVALAHEFRLNGEIAQKKCQII